MASKNLAVMNYDPLAILGSYAVGEGEGNHDEFMKLLKRLYRHIMFKPILDLMATRAMNGLLSFYVAERQNYHRELGLCRVIEGNIFNYWFNAFRTEKIHQVVIRHIAGGVLMHEIGHVLEQLAGFNLARGGFEEAVKKDLTAKRSRNVALRTVVENLMVNEVQAYHASQYLSELFARYFEVLAMCSEVAGHAKDSGGYGIDQVHTFFSHTERWLVNNILSGNLDGKVDPKIAEYSMRYVKDIEEMPHLWTEERVHPKHRNPSKPKWTGTVKSIKS